MFVDFTFKGTAGSPAEINAAVFASLNLFAILAVQTVLCTLLYLFVLAARARYSRMASQLAFQARVMAQFHRTALELKLAELTAPSATEAVSTRRALLTEKVRTVSEDAHALADDVAYEVALMGVFRSAGLVAFCSIIVTCGFLIAFAVGATLYLCFVAMFAYLRFGDRPDVEHLGYIA